MPGSSQTERSGQFIDPFPYLSLLIAGGVFFALLIGSFWGRTLVAKTIAVDPDVPTELPPISLKQEAIGALRIDVQARVPTNQWVTYEIQLKDQQGKILASGIKQAWSETGTWAEDGESGTWAEEDVYGGLDVRTKQAEPVTIALDVLEYSDITGKDLDQPVAFQVNVKNGVVDTRYLWAGLIGSTILAFLSLFAVPTSGKTASSKSMDDSEVAVREVVGGPRNLLRVVVKLVSDEHSPASLDVRLIVKDGNGEPVYEQTRTVRLSLTKENNRVTAGKGSLTTFFILEPRGSYSFFAEVIPDRTVDRTTIIVREHARTVFPVNVFHFTAPT
jgi:hypothetical protein